jgi:hypothetical protein
MRQYPEQKRIEIEGRGIHYFHIVILYLYQGNSISPMPFSINLISLTEQLNTGYLQHISHFLYTDDLKLTRKTGEELKNSCKELKPSAMISIWNSDLTRVQILCSGKEN